MKFLAVSFSVLLIVSVCLAFIYPPKLDKRHYENAWYDGNNYSFYLKRNHQFSLWKNSNNKLNFVGAGNWKIHEGVITLGNVKNSRLNMLVNTSCGKPLPSLFITHYWYQQKKILISL